MEKEKIKVIELKDEELEKVSGGGEYGTSPGKWFNTNDIVEDGIGVRYKILGLDSIEYEGYSFETKWFDALVLYVPEPAKSSTSCREGDIHHVNSSFVHRV